jgi:hypothetical protein
MLFSNFKNFGQFIFPSKIPLIIINFNQLENLKKTIQFAQSYGFEEIVIIDNTSTYPPLLEYYEEICNDVTLLRMESNYGHMVFFKNTELYNKYGKNFFILTDADIEPNKNLPKNFRRILLKNLLKYYSDILKVGFALKIDDIPNSYPARDKVLKWEKKFWEDERSRNIFFSHIDTTFALYKPDPKRNMKFAQDFYLAIRIGGNMTARHLGWYINYHNLSDEQRYYTQLADSSSSWIIDDLGKTKSDDYQ